MARPLSINRSEIMQRVFAVVRQRILAQHVNLTADAVARWKVVPRWHAAKVAALTGISEADLCPPKPRAKRRPSPVLPVTAGAMDDALRRMVRLKLTQKAMGRVLKCSGTTIASRLCVIGKLDALEPDAHDTGAHGHA